MLLRTRRAVREGFACVVLLVAGVPSNAQDAGRTSPPADDRPDSLFSADYVRSLWGDLGGVLTEPTRWDESNWGTAGVWTGGTLLAAAFDSRIRYNVQLHDRTPGEDRFYKQWEKLGAEYSFVEIGAFELWGVTADNREARDTAMDAVSATIIASGVIAPVLKYSVGRYRPTQTSRAFKFRPFSGHQSFPSGHATQAFAVATVVAMHYPEWWEQSLSYGAAAIVGFARIQQNAHFASDVVAGAGIGWAVGRAVVGRHGLPHGYTVAPWFGDGAGLLMSRDF